jgi:hypothetical protein
MTELFSKLLTEYGLSTAILILLVVLFIYFLKWFTGQVEAMRVSSLAREEKLLCIIEGYQDALNKHTEQVKDLNTVTQTAHMFQREEHQSMLTSLKEVEKALGRINGYRDDH